MKRNNLFFLSYSFFIFVCFFVKQFWDYPLWSVFVAAITVSGLLFALADFAKLQSDSLKTISLEQHGFAEYALDEIQMIKKATSARLNQTDNFHDSVLYSKEDQIEYYTSLQALLSDTAKDLINLKSQMLKYKKLAKIFSTTSACFYMTGYFAMFCIIVFEPIAKPLINQQESMTVLAFGLILLTQFFEGFAEAEKIKIANKIETLKNSLDRIRKSAEAEVLHNAD